LLLISSLYPAQQARQRLQVIARSPVALNAIERDTLDTGKVSQK
jgi:hypothetical protein